MKAEQRQIVWMELYLAVVKCCEEDHIGSVTRIYNSSGTTVFSAEYDPWGVQTVTTNTIGYRSERFGIGSFTVPSQKAALYNYRGMKNKGQIRLYSTSQYGLTIFWKEK